MYTNEMKAQMVWFDASEVFCTTRCTDKYNWRESTQVSTKELEIVKINSCACAYIKVRSQVVCVSLSLCVPVGGIFLSYTRK